MSAGGFAFRGEHDSIPDTKILLPSTELPTDCPDITQVHEALEEWYPEDIMETLEGWTLYYLINTNPSARCGTPIIVASSTDEEEAWHLTTFPVTARRPDQMSVLE